MTISCNQCPQRSINPQEGSAEYPNASKEKVMSSDQIGFFALHREKTEADVVMTQQKKAVKLQNTASL